MSGLIQTARVVFYVDQKAVISDSANQFYTKIFIFFVLKIEI